MKLCLALLLGATLLAAATASAQNAPSDSAGILAEARKEAKAGLKYLKEARAGNGNPRVLARQALKSLERAHKLFDTYIDREGATPKIDDEMAELQSLLYWTRKMTPLAEEEPREEKNDKPRVDPEKDLPGGEKPAPSQPSPTKPPPGEKTPPPAVDKEAEARTLFEAAERFEKENPDAFFAISARYFEVVDRFRGSSFATRALERCMAYQRKLMERQRASNPQKKPPTPQPPPSKSKDYTPPQDITLIRLNLRHPNASIRAANVMALVGILKKKALPELHALFLGDDAPEVFTTVLEQLAIMKAPQTLKFARKALGIRNIRRAERVMDLAVAMKKYEYARLILIALAVNASPVTPSGRPIYSGFVAPYAARVESAFQGGLRARAIECIGKMGPEGIKGLRKCLKGRSLVTCESILCLGVLKAHKSAGYISVFLQRKNRLRYRCEAMAALHIIGIDAVPTLRIWSAYQLREMTGQPWSASATGRWWAWYRTNKR
jgi:hypothetical protein